MHCIKHLSSDVWRNITDLVLLHNFLRILQAVPNQLFAQFKGRATYFGNV
jgi:hypothetical protein